MAWLGLKPECRQAMDVKDVYGLLHRVESVKSAYVLARYGRRARPRRIWIDRDDGTEWICLRINHYRTLAPVDPVYDANGKIGMYEMAEYCVESAEK